ncbi:MAG: hypothetical protein AMJ54_00475 [Deltaproteobacteria bacterium SG8_13]|nr:MAG: hypothetical protein AMJ54_00475 [Deltaproteobacteria bacterium SG8_13]
MDQQEKRVDGFRFMPPGLAAWIQTFIPDEQFNGPIPWTPLARPLSQATVALITSAGISCKSDPPFDMEREKREPTWGDPTYRCIPRNTAAADIDVNHLHINTDYIRKDPDVMLPLTRLAEFEAEGIIGRLAQTAYSFYGFQWQNERFIDEAIRPMASRMKSEQVEAVLLTPA